MSEPPSPAPLSPEQRQRLADDAVRTLRLLADALEQAGAGPGAEDAPALLARVQAAVQPLRASPAVAITSTSSVGGPPRPPRAAVVLSSVSSVTVGRPVAQGSGSGTATTTATGGGYAVAQGSGSGTATVTAEAGGEAPFTATAEDVPWVLWEILVKLDEMSERELSPIDITNWITAVISLLSACIALLKML